LRKTNLSGNVAHLSDKAHPRVLDVGCGTGVLLKQLTEQFPEAELYGVDSSADMLM